MAYPAKNTIEEWEKYVDRNLTKSEKKLIQNYNTECYYNQHLEYLHDVCNTKGLYVYRLTVPDGNCMFESLVELGYGESIRGLRQFISFIMYHASDIKHFFADKDESLRELFNVYNEVQHVFCEEEQKIYEYTYEVMCYDLASDNSWNNLPTELILLVISKIFDIEIVILNNQSDWEHTICYGEPNFTIYLGHLDELHYVPLDILSEEHHPRIYYDEYNEVFQQWCGKIKNEVQNKNIFNDIYDEPSNNISDYIDFS